MLEIQQRNSLAAAASEGTHHIAKGDAEAAGQSLGELVRIGKGLPCPFAKAAGQAIAQGRALQAGLAIGRRQGPGQAGVGKAAAAGEIAQGAAVAKWL